MLLEQVFKELSEQFAIEDMPRTFEVDDLQRAIRFATAFAEKQVKPAPSNIVPLSKADRHFERAQQTRQLEHLECKRQFADLMHDMEVLAQAVESAKSNNQRTVVLNLPQQNIVKNLIPVLAGTLTPSRDFAGKTLSPRQKIAVRLEKSLAAKA